MGVVRRLFAKAVLALASKAEIASYDVMETTSGAAVAVGLFGAGDLQADSVITHRNIMNTLRITWSETL